MGLQDRDYMRERQRALWSKPRISWRQKVATVTAIIGLLGAAVWLLRDVQTVAEDFRPGKGSLVVNINTATRDELESIPRVGPTLAAQIIAGRPYKNVDELISVSGIGPSSLDGMRPFITTDEETRKKELN